MKHLCRLFKLTHTSWRNNMSETTATFRALFDDEARFKVFADSLRNSLSREMEEQGSRESNFEDMDCEFEGVFCEFPHVIGRLIGPASLDLAPFIDSLRKNAKYGYCNALDDMVSEAVATVVADGDVVPAERAQEVVDLMQQSLSTKESDDLESRGSTARQLLSGTWIHSDGGWNFKLTFRGNEFSIEKTVDGSDSRDLAIGTFEIAETLATLDGNLRGDSPGDTEVAYPLDLSYDIGNGERRVVFASCTFNKSGTCLYVMGLPAFGEADIFDFSENYYYKLDGSSPSRRMPANEYSASEFNRFIGSSKIEVPPGD
jgi:hypothetical protein